MKRKKNATTITIILILKCKKNANQIVILFYFTMSTGDFERVST